MAMHSMPFNGIFCSQLAVLACASIITRHYLLYLLACALQYRYLNYVHYVIRLSSFYYIISITLPRAVPRRLFGLYRWY
jgi:hypothetical protein